MSPGNNPPSTRRYEVRDDRAEFSYEQRRNAAIDAVRMVSATLDGDR